jgi:hypothetical protein
MAVWKLKQSIYSPSFCGLHSKLNPIPERGRKKEQLFFDKCSNADKVTRLSSLLLNRLVYNP